MITTETIVPGSRIGGSDLLLAVKTNGGSVTVAHKVGDDYVTALVIASDGSYIVDARLAVKITPAGGAAYDYN